MAIYDTAYIGTTNNRVTFNNFSSTPVYRVLAERPQRRDVRELDIPVAFESGISDFATYIGETAYIIEGRMYPSDEAEYDSGVRALRKVANLDIAQDDNLSDNGYVPYVWTESNGNQKQLFVKVLYADIKKDTRQGLVQPFRLVCKVKDPTVHGITLKTASTEGSDPTTASGTAEYSFEYPIIFGASTYSVSSSAVNNGDQPAYPQSITIVGPVNKPKITNSTTGEYIEVDTNLATSSNTLVITYDKDTLSVEADGVSVQSKVSEDSTYFKLQEGTNNFTLTGTSIGSGAYAAVTFYDAYPLS